MTSLAYRLSVKPPHFTVCLCVSVRLSSYQQFLDLFLFSFS